MSEPRTDAVFAKWPHGADFEERERDLEILARELEREVARLVKNRSELLMAVQRFKEEIDRIRY